MRNLSLFFFSFLAILFIVPACRYDFEVNTDLIRFDQLAIGQRSRYIGFEGDDYWHGDGLDFTHSDDTLVLEIVGQDAQGFKVAETLHYAGNISKWYSTDRDSTYFYYLNITNDTLQLAPIGTDYVRSRIFVYHYPADGLPLANFVDTQVDIKGWKSSFPLCECRKTGFTKNYKVFGKKYPLLNVLMDDSDMQSDGPGHTYVYAAKYGIVKFSESSAWTGNGYGWDLLPN